MSSFILLTQYNVGYLKSFVIPYNFNDCFFLFQLKTVGGIFAVPMSRAPQRPLGIVQVCMQKQRIFIATLNLGSPTIPIQQLDQRALTLVEAGFLRSKGLGVGEFQIQMRVKLLIGQE